VTHVEDGALAACELCYAGATDEEMAQCAVDVDPEGLECELIAALDAAGMRGMTIVAYALVSVGGGRGNGTPPAVQAE
jgi:hypothetical protein